MNNKKVFNTVMLSVTGLLVAAAAVFVCLSIFTEPKNDVYIHASLLCSFTANLLNVIRSVIDMKRKKPTTEHPEM